MSNSDGGGSVVTEEPRRSSRPTLVSRVQGPLQAWLRPGQWCFGVRAIRQGSERWRVGASAEQLLAALSEAVSGYQQGQPEGDGLSHTCKVRIGKQRVRENGTAFVRIENYTQTAEWLDVLELHISPAEGSSGSGASECNVDVKSFSSGFLPTCIPCAPLLNAALCWIPFSDFTPDVCLVLGVSRGGGGRKREEKKRTAHRNITAYVQ